MDEMMALALIRNPDDTEEDELSNQTITTPTTLPTWKLYENPFFNSQLQQQQQQQQQQQEQEQEQEQLQLHRRGRRHRLPLRFSARKIAASLWDLSFFRSIMDSELEIVRTQIVELRSELQFEREARKKVESMNKKLAKELSEERKGREAVERVCDVLAKEIASDKAQIDRMRREMEEERKMMRMAEVLREERIQMKLTEAKTLFEEKLLELELDFTKPKGFQFQFHSPSSVDKTKAEEDSKNTCNELATSKTSSGYGSHSCNSKNSNLTSPDFDNGGGGGGGRSIMNQNQRRASAEAENPHIKRGIKGFVEFPRVVRAIGPRGRHSSSKLECQKAQLRLLLRHRSPIRSHNLIMS